MTAPFYLVPSTLVKRLERFLDRFEAVPCHQPKPTGTAPHLAAFLVEDINCAGFWCAHCETVQLAEDFGPVVPKCAQDGCPYTGTGCVLKQCGSVKHAFELGPEDARAKSDQPDRGVPLGALALPLLHKAKRLR